MFEFLRSGMADPESELGNASAAQPDVATLLESARVAAATRPKPSWSVEQAALVATAFYSASDDGDNAPPPMVWVQAVLGTHDAAGLVDVLDAADGFEAERRLLGGALVRRCARSRETMYPGVYEASRLALAGASPTAYEAARARAARSFSPNRGWIAFLFPTERDWIEATTAAWMARTPSCDPEERWTTHGNWLLASAVDMDAASRVLEHRLAHHDDLHDLSWAYTLLQRFGADVVALLERARDVAPLDDLLHRLGRRRKPAPARKRSKGEPPDAITQLPQAPRDRLVRAIRKTARLDAEAFATELDAVVDDTGELAARLLADGQRELVAELGTLDDAVRAAAVLRYRREVAKHLALDLADLELEPAP